MDDQRRQVLQAELDDAVSQRAELDTYIAVLAKRLGIEVSSLPGGSGDPADNGGALPVTGDPVSAVHEAQFYGMSGPKASKALLRMMGRDRPLKTQEIYDAITKGGVRIGNSATLYRSLTRDKDFHKVGRGRWGLTEWYPNAKRGGRDSESDEQAADSESPEPTVLDDVPEAADPSSATES